MGSKKKPDIPDAPDFKSDARVDQGIDQLFGLGTDAANLNLSGKMAETIETSPQMTTKYLEGLRAQLEPMFGDIRTDTVNRLAAQGQLGGSTLTSEMGKIERNMQNQYITQSSNFGMADINRAMSNRMQVYGQGLNAISQGTGYGLQGQQQKNTYAMQKHEADVAAQIANQDTSNGSGWGSALGMIAGGLLAIPTGGLSVGLASGAVGAGAALGGSFGGAVGGMF